MASGAYIKLEGEVHTDLVRGAKPGNVERLKLTFFKGDEKQICQETFANSGKYVLKASLVRTLFTEQLKTYWTYLGPSKYASVTPSELTFSNWYRKAVPEARDVVSINTTDEGVCRSELKRAVSGEEVGDDDDE